MPNDDMRLIQPSIARIFVVRRSIGQAFYERLFERQPTFRTMFPTDLRTQARTFDDMIALIVKKTGDPEAVTPVLLAIGRRYLTYGLRPQDLRVIGEVLMEVLCAQTPGGLSPDEAAAWERSFSRAAEVVKLTLADPVPVEG
ncbi:globin domain-containing protein [Palleronia marisminoris]|nr:globin domain-containing protein [Palleronia marisminoris]